MKEASEETAGFGGGKNKISDGADLLRKKYSEKTVGRPSESKDEGRGEEKFLPSMELKFRKSCLQVVLDWIFAEK